MKKYFKIIGMSSGIICLVLFLMPNNYYKCPPNNEPMTTNGCVNSCLGFYTENVCYGIVYNAQNTENTIIQNKTDFWKSDEMTIKQNGSKKYLKHFDGSISKIRIDCKKDSDCEIRTDIYDGCDNSMSIRKRFLSNRSLIEEFNKKEEGLLSDVKVRCEKLIPLHLLNPICENNICQKNEPVHFLFGQKHIVQNEIINEDGREIKIENTNTPIDGIKIVIPDGAVKNNTKLEIGYYSGQWILNRNSKNDKFSMPLILNLDKNLNEMTSPIEIYKTGNLAYQVDEKDGQLGAMLIVNNITHTFRSKNIITFSNFK